jgi:hypothetical protein
MDKWMKGQREAMAKSVARRNRNRRLRHKPTTLA